MKSSNKAFNTNKGPLSLLFSKTLAKGIKLIINTTGNDMSHNQENKTIEIETAWAFA